MQILQCLNSVDSPGLYPWVLRMLKMVSWMLTLPVIEGILSNKVNALRSSYISRDRVWLTKYPHNPTKSTTNGVELANSPKLNQISLATTVTYHSNLLLCPARHVREHNTKRKCYPVIPENQTFP